MTSLADKVLALHGALSAADLPHAFGGALALAWCTRQPRGTSDIDVNVFVPESDASTALAAMPSQVSWEETDVQMLRRDGQARLWWQTTPVDVFLSTTAFHQAAMARTHLEPFGPRMVPFLACEDLAVFKAFFNRRRDWADMEDMVRAGTIEAERVVAELLLHLGRDDERIAELRSIAAEVERGA